MSAEPGKFYRDKLQEAGIILETVGQVLDSDLAQLRSQLKPQTKLEERLDNQEDVIGDMRTMLRDVKARVEVLEGKQGEGEGAGVGAGLKVVHKKTVDPYTYRSNAGWLVRMNGRLFVQKKDTKLMVELPVETQRWLDDAPEEKQA